MMITHTVKDLESLEADFDIMKAKGFIERAGAVIVGALPRGEMEKLDNIIPSLETTRRGSRPSPPRRLRSDLGKPAPPPGRGISCSSKEPKRIPGTGSKR
ncbi:hypothetical protein GS934_02000 [Rhodococcus hoagii]|nr:hypothetical protein [Prescottella equi]NKZ86892.1 hypothetical protein [Prescottella equi]